MNDPAGSLPPPSSRVRSTTHALAQLGRLLKTRHGIAAEHFGELQTQATRAMPLEQLLVRSDAIAEPVLLSLLSEITQYPKIRMAGATVDPVAIEAVPARVVVAYRIIPLEISDEAVTFATAQLQDLSVEDDLRILTGRSIRWVLCTFREIDECIKHYYGVAIETFLGLDRSGVDRGSGRRGGNGRPEPEAAPDMSAFVQRVLADAAQCRASDVHFEPEEDGLRLRYRIDGVLYPIRLPQGMGSYHRGIASGTKVMAQLNIAERRLPQDGRFSLTLQDETVDVRVSILPTPHGESVNLRILNRDATFLDLDELGLTEEQRTRLDELITLPSGMVVFTGPTGSGKTTSLYAALARRNNTQVNIITVEDPIEYRIEGITQLQVNREIGFTFANGLRSILRHDPDVILIGEIRDHETATIAIHAALTGHLVFTTLHTNDSASAVTRLVNMEIEPYLVASSVQGMVAQRLIRRICEACRESLPDQAPVWEQIRREVPGDVATRALYQGRGCPECRFTGFVGRQAIFEVLPMTDALRSMIVAHAPSTEMMQLAVEQGLETLRQRGWACVLDGSSSVDDVLRASRRIQPRKR